MVSGKKKTSPKQPHLKPPPPDALHHLCYLSVSQYYFDINSAELLFTSFDDIEEPLQLFMDKPDLQELYVELKKARTFIIDPPDQGSYDLAKKYLTDFHMAFRVMYYNTLMQVCPNVDINHYYQLHEQRKISTTYLGQFVVRSHYNKVALCLRDDMDLLRQVGLNHATLNAEGWDLIEKELDLPIQLAPMTPNPFSATTFPLYGAKKPATPATNTRSSSNSHDNTDGRMSETSTPDTKGVLDAAAAAADNEAGPQLTSIMVEQKRIKKLKSSRKAKEKADREQTDKKRKATNVDTVGMATKSVKKSSTDNAPNTKVTSTKTSKSTSDDNVTNPPPSKVVAPKIQMMGTMAPSHLASFPAQQDENTNIQVDIPQADNSITANVASARTEAFEHYMIESFPDLTWTAEKLDSRLELGALWSYGPYSDNFEYSINDSRMKKLRKFLKAMGKYQTRDKSNQVLSIHKDINEWMGDDELMVWKTLPWPTHLLGMGRTGCFDEIPPAIHLEQVNTSLLNVKV